MSKVIEIHGIIVTGVELSHKIKGVSDLLIPEAPEKLKNKFSWLQCSLKNETQFTILIQKSYFNSGRYWDAPFTVEQFDQLVFSGCNEDFTPTGVTGGTAFRLQLDDKHYYDFALGWTNPLIGSYKAAVVESSNPEDGYKAATDIGGSITSKHIFKGKDKNDKPASFQIHISAAPGQQPQFVVTQIELV